MIAMGASLNNDMRRITEKMHLGALINPKQRVAESEPKPGSRT